VRAPEYEVYQQTLVLHHGDRITITVTMEPKMAAAVIPPEPASASRSSDPSPENHHTAKPYVVGGAAVVGLTGLGFGIFATVNHQQAVKQSKDLGHSIDQETGGTSSACVDPDADLVSLCRELDEARQEKVSMQTMMIVGYSTFGVGLAAAVAVQLLWKTPQIDVALQPGGAYLGWHTQF
jgi:hypothetical protein